MYRDLDERESAESAFREAIKANPCQADAYNALALNYYNRARYEEAMRYCKLGLNVRPHDARAWDLKGMAQRRRWEESHSLRLTAGQHPEAWQEIIPTRAIATAFAWCNLCWETLRSRPIEKAKRIAKTCTRNLAVAHAMVKNPISYAIFHQAIYLAPNDPELYFELGKTLLDAGRCQDAAQAFEHVRAHELWIVDQAGYWAYYANAQANLFAKTHDDKYKNAVCDAYNRFLDVAASADESALKSILDKDVDKDEPELPSSDYVDKLREALECLESVRVFLKSLTQIQDESSEDYIKQLTHELASNEEQQTKCVESVRDFLKSLTQKLGEPTEEYVKRLKHELASKEEQQTKCVESVRVFLKSLTQIQDESSEDYIKRLEDMFTSGKYQDWPWASAQLKIRTAKQYVYRSTDFGKAQTYLKDSIDTLKEDHADAIRDDGLHGTLAWAYVGDNKTTEALFHAERAVALKPEGALEHSILGEIYWKLKDYKRAEVEWNTCFNLQPDADTLLNIASTYWSRGVEIRKPAERKEALQQAVNRFKHALALWKAVRLTKITRLIVQKNQRIGATGISS